MDAGRRQRGVHEVGDGPTEAVANLVQAALELDLERDGLGEGATQQRVEAISDLLVRPVELLVARPERRDLPDPTSAAGDQKPPLLWSARYSGSDWLRAPSAARRRFVSLAMAWSCMEVSRDSRAFMRRRACS